MSYLNNEFHEQYLKADGLLSALLAKLDYDQMLANESDPERANTGEFPSSPLGTYHDAKQC
jgi:hypothetical protein